MASTLYKGSGKIVSGDFKAVKWTGKTKGGDPVEISFQKAINLGNIDWTFAEKDDVVPEIEMTAVYSNTDTASTSDEEPWQVEYTQGQNNTASKSILLGAGVFSIGGTDVALTRGGGSFVVEREYREINADGDRGPVEDRIVMMSSRAKLKLNMLSFMTRVADMYPAITAATTS